VILGLETFRGRAKFSTWVGRIVLNKWSDYNKNRELERRLYAEARRGCTHDPERQSKEEGAPAEKRGQMVIPTFQRTLDAQIAVWDMERVLSEKDRFLFNQVWREGRTHREIAESSGKSQHAVESTVRRLRGRLAAV